jgi:hypothetical protein
MKKLSDAEYYAARLEAERKAIEHASCEQARLAHEALADHYVKLQAEAGHRPDGIPPEIPRQVCSEAASASARMGSTA